MEPNECLPTEAKVRRPYLLPLANPRHQSHLIRAMCELHMRLTRPQAFLSSRTRSAGAQIFLNFLSLRGQGNSNLSHEHLCLVLFTLTAGA